MDFLKDYFKDSLDCFSKKIYCDVERLLCEGKFCEGVIFLGKNDRRVLNYLSNQLNVQFEDRGFECIAFASEIVPEGIQTYNDGSGVNGGFYFLVNVDYYLNEGEIKRIPTFDNFVSSYVYGAFNLLGGMTLSLKQFEEDLNTLVSRTSRLDEKLLKHLYPLFHHEFFTYKEDSVFLLKPSISKDSNFEVSVGSNVNGDDLNSLVDLILDNNLVFLMSKIGAFYNSPRFRDAEQLKLPGIFYL